MKKLWLIAGVPVLLLTAAGCSIKTENEVNVKPIEIKPIHIKIDVNVKIDKELDDFFGDLDTNNQKESKK